MNTMKTISSALLLLILLEAADAFSSVPSAGLLSPTKATATQFRQSASTILRATEDDEEEDDDDEIDDASLGDWRKFRASLIDGGLPTEGSDGEAKETKKEKKPVAEKNAALLAEQNEELAKEYREGVWAHTVGQPEVGGLLCRMPLEAEVYFAESGHWKEKLDLMLGMDPLPVTTTSDKLDEEVDTDVLTVSKVDHWFQTADRMITKELEAITNGPTVKNGVLNPNDLGENECALLLKYLSYKNTWQEVCLLLSHNPESGSSESVVINRPITKSINKQLAVMLLEGNSGSGKGSFSYDFVDQVVQAFGQEAAVYLGGPDDSDEPAILIHGIAGLQGARELAPGTGIYRGGWEAAVEGVIRGDYKPLDFRFFVGKQSYDLKEHPERGAIMQKIDEGAYKPLACARSLALKQCLGLPKPLWHEVLELCGGELKALSTIELRKRADLQQ